MSIYMWRFKTIPDPREVERFIEEQVPLFSRYARYLTGADREPVVDLMRVEHNCGAVNLEFQFNGVDEESGDVFCFPGYYPGDLDEEGNPLFNYCDTGGQYYGRIVAKILDRARKEFDMEITINVNNQRQLHPAC